MHARPPLIIYVLVALFSIPNCIFGQTFVDSSALLSGGAGQFFWGASAADVNNDGRVDIYYRGRLLIANEENSFVNERTAAGLFDNGGTFGAAFGDYDNDGYLDVFLENFQTESLLYQNNQDRTFTSVANQIGLSVAGFTQGAAWGDYNRDGRLDLYVNEDFGNNQLFENLDYDTFQEVTDSAGVVTNGNSYGTAWGDYNNDGFPDIFIATCNPSAANSIKHLLLNRGDGTFVDVNYDAGVADSLPSWGIVWLDYDNDYDLDIYITNIYEPPRSGANVLYRNEGDGTFTDVSVAARVAGDLSENSYGVAAADFDNDGWIDIYVANQNRRHRLYRNLGDGEFEDIAATANIFDEQGRALAVADYNNDGQMDVFTVGLSAYLLYNEGTANNWISIATRGLISNFYGVGTRVEVVTDTLRQIREIQAGDSFCSQNDLLRAHFGLGSATSVDSIIINWSAGVREVLTNVDVNQRITIVEGVGIRSLNDYVFLNLPQDGDTLNPLDATVDFAWDGPLQNSAGEAVSYSLSLSGGSIDTTFTNIADTAFSYDLALLEPENTYTWMLEATDGYTIRASRSVGSFYYPSGLTGIETGRETLPKEITLYQNYPNPFNPQTTIRYYLPSDSKISLKIYNSIGEVVVTLVDERQSAGWHQAVWQTSTAASESTASGIYFYQLQSGTMTLTEKMVLIR